MNAQEMFDSGLLSYQNNDMKQAVYIWEKAAKEGNVNAMINLGLCYTKHASLLIGLDVVAPVPNARSGGIPSLNAYKKYAVSLWNEALTKGDNQQKEFARNCIKLQEGK